MLFLHRLFSRRNRYLPLNIDPDVSDQPPFRKRRPPFVTTAVAAALILASLIVNIVLLTGDARAKSRPVDDFQHL